jgi:PAS domain S-box-containing protein
LPAVGRGVVVQSLYIPSFAVGASIGLVINFTLAVVSLVSLIIYRKYLPLRYVTLFFCALSAFFLGYVLYCYDFSEQWVVRWYRVLLWGLIWMPVAWVWLLYALSGEQPGLGAKILLSWAAASTLALLFIEHPAVDSGPLIQFTLSGVRHPQSWLFRPMIYGVGLAVNLISIVFLWRRRHKPPLGPKYAGMLLAGLLLWVLGGLHDAVYTLGWASPLKATTIWWVSTCLSLCLALTVVFQIKKLENQLIKSREQFSKAFQAGPGWMVVSTLEHGRVLEVNDTLLRETGYKREEIVGLSTLEQGLWADPGQRKQGLDKLMAEGCLREEEVTIRPLGGREYVLAWSGEIIEWQGQPALLSIFHDITERKQAEERIAQHKELLEQEVARRTAELMETNRELNREIGERQRSEQALKESQGNLQRLFDSLQDLLFVLTPQGQLVHANRQSLDRLGYRLAELRGMHILELHQPSRRQETAAGLEDIIAGKSDTLRIPLLTKAGESIPAETKITMGRWDHRDALFGISRDISERMRAEESLSQLAAGVAHNFNNLLAAVLGNAQAARAELDKPHSNQTNLRRLLDNVVRSADSGRGVVQRLASYVGRRQSGDEPRRAVELTEVLAAAVEIARAAFRHMGMAMVEVVLDLPDQLFVEAERSELMEVFLNLIKNAVEAMPQGGSLVIRAWAEGGRAQVSFSDTGIGMDQETCNRLFQPFFSTKGVCGQGLGLASCRGILRSLGGDIAAFSQIKCGTTFSLRLPLCLSPAEEPKAAAGNNIAPGRSVLLVEDEALVAMGLTAILEGAGLKVSLASQVREARASLAHSMPDLLLCDLGLPDGTGWDIAVHLAELASANGHHTPPMILLTGWAADNAWGPPPQEAAPVYAVLHKPVDRALLLDSVARALALPKNPARQ